MAVDCWSKASRDGGKDGQKGTKKGKSEDTKGKPGVKSKSWSKGKSQGKTGKGIGAWSQEGYSWPGGETWTSDDTQQTGHT